MFECCMTYEVGHSELGVWNKAERRIPLAKGKR